MKNIRTCSICLTRCQPPIPEWLSSGSFATSTAKMTRPTHAQFSPFAALAGYDDALRETARRTDRFVELDEDRKQEIDRQISYLQQHLLDTVPVKIIYFVPDEKKDGGSYTAVEGCVRKIDENTKSLRIQGTEIPVERIYGIDFL